MVALLVLCCTVAYGLQVSNLPFQLASYLLVHDHFLEWLWIVQFWLKLLILFNILKSLYKLFIFGKVQRMFF